jgi:hypothetical protein
MCSYSILSSSSLGPFLRYVNYHKSPVPSLNLVKASSVVSVQAFVLLLNFGLLLPSYNRIGSKYLGSATYASFAIMVGSSIVLCAGAVAVGLSSASAAFLRGMAIYTLGEGITVATQAYIASVIGKLLDWCGAGIATTEISRIPAAA